MTSFKSKFQKKKLLPVTEAMQPPTVKIIPSLYCRQDHLMLTIGPNNSKRCERGDMISINNKKELSHYKFDKTKCDIKGTHCIFIVGDDEICSDWSEKKSIGNQTFFAISVITTRMKK